MHVPRWCIGHASGSAMLLVPDSTYLAPNVGLEIKSIRYLRAQRLRKAMLAAIYIYPVYIEYRRKFGEKSKVSKTPASHQGR